MTLKIGDVVQLKSGGPKMTVYFPDCEDIHTQWYGYIHTQWMDNNNQLNRATFVSEALTKIELPGTEN